MLTLERKRRNPKTATWLSIVPGLGQFYNGRNVEGALFSAGGILFGTLFIRHISATDNIEQSYSNELSHDDKAGNNVIAYCFLAGWSMYRANKQAHSYNEKLYQQSDAIEKFRIAIKPSSNGINLALCIQF